MPTHRHTHGPPDITYVLEEYDDGREGLEPDLLLGARGVALRRAPAVHGSAELRVCADARQ